MVLLMVLAEWKVGQFVWAVFWLTLFFIWIWLLISVFADIFRSDDLGGIAKFLWCALVIVTPYLGVFVYLIVRGHKMGERAIRRAQQQEEAAQAYIRSVAGGAPSMADELAKLADLRAKGVIDDAEFARMKAKLLA